MSVPLATIFGGDVTLELGSDVSQFGWGDLTTNRKVIIGGTEDSTGAMSIGSLLVSGGGRIEKSLHVHKDLNVLYGITNLTETHIDTTNGPTTITGGNRVDISVGAASQFVTTGGNLTLTSSNNQLLLRAGLNSSSAIDLTSTHMDGGIRLMSGNGLGNVDLVTGSGGINGFTSSGNVTITANNASGLYRVASVSANQNITFALEGETDSQVRILSSGTNETRDAIVIQTTNTAGKMVMSNTGGLGSGQISMLTGSGGYVLRTNTGGTLSMTAQGASAQFRVNSASSGQNMIIGMYGNTDSGLFLQSEGTNVLNSAIELKTLSTSGNIVLTQVTGEGQIRVRSGSGGYDSATQTGGSTTVTTYGATSLFTNTTMADGEDLTISVTGNTNSKVNIASSGTSNNAILLQTTNGTGGVTVESVGGVYLQSADAIKGVEIATGTNGIPVKIGTSTSTTTIMGNLDVKGVVTTIESQVVTVDDNIMVVNNAPSGASDGGLAIKRFQSANDLGTGEVVLDSPEDTGTVQNGDNTLTTIHLDSTANVVNDYYNGWWVKITSGTGAGQVRRIKAYNGSTKIATIYSTAEQTGLLDNPQPVEGMDFTTVPDTTSVYALFPCHYVMAIWDESANEFALVCAPDTSSTQVGIAHYSNLHLAQLQADAVNTTYLNGNLADISTIITLNNGLTTPVSVTAFPQNYGIYLIFIKPVLTTTRAYAIFMIGRVNESSTPGTIVRLISVKGTQFEQLDMQWRANEYPEVYYRPKPIGGTGTTDYQVKIVSL